MNEKSPDRITPRAEDYSRWYLDVIRQANLAEAAEVVKGCMVIKPHGYAIWEKIQRALDDMFKATGHQNAYFPLLIPESFITKEAEHVEGFSPELAVVTHAGGKKLEENYVIRPTSETIIGHFFSRWIESYRDLPMLINQWANVMRWELRTRMFLRTSEFLWQEGHTAHASHEEAREEVLRMLGIYSKFAEEWMAMPIIRGVKTQTEKFAGALESYCIEAMMQDGKALQAGTSHDLGQNFGKAFDVRFQTAEGKMEYVWQTSWGVSTRLIGGLIMTHSDDNGLVLPPKLAPIHIAIVPILKAGSEAIVVEAGESVKKELSDRGLSVVFDTRDYKPGFKYFEWEQKGVPLRIEIGPKDVEKGSVAVKGRLADKKEFWERAGLGERVVKWLDNFQQELFETARERRKDNTVRIDTWDEFKSVFADQNSKFAYCHWDGTAETEAKIKEETRVTVRCIPENAEEEDGACVFSGKPSKRRVLFAKAY
ncbi:MAG: proline--tRNA ligase [Deltaproteobacteria bacterium RIFOXYB12_FULL_58_9]|nr:MAG: proline--tRNA ligase [Deltaproteobacteria bacterium RIFOXYB12_FULL_58_9]